MSAEELPIVLPTRRNDVLVAEFDAEYVLLDPKNQMAHHLVGRLAAVYDACDGRTVTDELVAEAVAVTAVDADEFRGFVGDALNFFSNFGLLEGTELVVDEGPPCLGCGEAPSKRRRWRRWLRR